jgi:hypothetical protein
VIHVIWAAAIFGFRWNCDYRLLSLSLPEFLGNPCACWTTGRLPPNLAYFGPKHRGSRSSGIIRRSISDGGQEFSIDCKPLDRTIEATAPHAFQRVSAISPGEPLLKANNAQASQKSAFARAQGRRFLAMGHAGWPQTRAVPISEKGAFPVPLGPWRRGSPITSPSSPFPAALFCHLHVSPSAGNQRKSGQDDEPGYRRILQKAANAGAKRATLRASSE